MRVVVARCWCVGLWHALALGFDVGINGCSLKTAESVAVAAGLPLGRLHLETDAPWCGIKPTHPSHAHVATTFPSKKKEKFEQGWLVKDRNEPCTMVSVLEVVAAARDCDPIELADAVYANTEKLFFP
jgi:TatD DNase family protein